MQNDLRQELAVLKSKNTKLQEEVKGWKAAAKREGLYGMLLGGAILFVVGVWYGSSF